MMMMRAKMMKAMTMMMMVRLNKEIKVLLWLLLSLVDYHHVVDDESKEDKQRD